MSKRVIILDTETTGLDKDAGDEIIEIGLVEMINGEIKTAKNIRYKSNKPIEIRAQNVHSISSFDLLNSPILNTPELNKLSEFINGDPLVIHNANFDMGMLDKAYSKYNLDFSKFHGKVIDTLKLARVIFKGTSQKVNLNALCDHYEIDKSERVYHGALIDCYLLSKVFLKLLPSYFDEDNNLDDSNLISNIKFDTDFKRYEL